jgi:hypothetical protein
MPPRVADAGDDKRAGHLPPLASTPYRGPVVIAEFAHDGDVVRGIE